MTRSIDPHRYITATFTGTNSEPGINLVITKGTVIDGSGDANHDSEITVDEIIQAVNAALNGWGG